MEGRDIDVHKTVDYTFPHEMVYVRIQVEMLCCFVHLM